MAYRPVLGEKGSYLKKGETAKFRIRITLQDSDCKRYINMLCMIFIIWTILSS